MALTHSDPRFLEATKATDVHHPVLQRIVARCRDEAQRWHSRPDEAPLVTLTKTIFRWVRDAIAYKLGIYHESASGTIVKGWGSCSNKANVLAAMLRAIGVPAGFVSMTVHFRYLGSQIPEEWEMARTNATAPSKHFYVVAWLNGRWTHLDPSDDIGVCRALEHFVPEAKRIDFDGYSDALLNLNPKYIYGREWPRRHVSKPWHFTWLNAVFTFTREHAAGCEDAVDYQRQLNRYLWRTIPIHHAAFLALVKWNHLTRRRPTSRELDRNVARGGGSGSDSRSAHSGSDKRQLPYYAPSKL